MKIHKQSNTCTAEAEISQELRFVNVVNRRYSLQLQNDEAFDHYVYNVAAIQVKAFIMHRLALLPFKLNTT